MRGPVARFLERSLLTVVGPASNPIITTMMKMTLETHLPHIARRLITALRVKLVRGIDIFILGFTIGYPVWVYPFLILIILWYKSLGTLGSNITCYEKAATT